jgi:hypothetical protein
MFSCNANRIRRQRRTENQHWPDVSLSMGATKRLKLKKRK